MIIALWLVTLTLCALTATLLVHLLLKDTRTKEALSVLKVGFQEGLRGCGLNIRKPKYPVDLYKWETFGEDASEECLDRATWPPMDIADWMQEGLPRMPDGSTFCGRKDCKCQLIPYKPKVRPKKSSQGR